MGPLLEWALAFITTFADDILDAHQHYQDRSGTAPPGGGDASRALLSHYAVHGLPLPADPVMRSGTRAGEVAWTVVVYRHGVPAGELARAYHRSSERHLLVVSPEPSLTALDLPIHGRFQDRPSISFISVFDVAPRRSSASGAVLLAHLRAACLIVVAYLTGARPGEIRGLRRGAAPPPALTAGGARLHLIHGQVRKGALAEADGIPTPGRDCVWATLAPAATAVRVAERINQTLGRKPGLLFSDCGALPDITTMTNWIRGFIDFVNERLVPHTAQPEALHIPPDPGGEVTPHAGSAATWPGFYGTGQTAMSPPPSSTSTCGRCSAPATQAPRRQGLATCCSKRTGCTASARWCTCRTSSTPGTASAAPSPPAP